ncbi:site-specific integrase [Peptoniphilus sp. MSJ-1]|uniref:Site-specific integrase n=1 Tax=Peptoniphilus ovalis TaxID=2841503 RepID=A0ABS6FK81_9FIRM|nr:site-specific integrase [Peptoniphilus ovalis]MBU5669676.1 site-specific integrase [Peptoniphilus ovalis]
MLIGRNGFMLDEYQERFLKLKKLEQVREVTIKNYISYFSRIDSKINQRLNYEDEDILCNQILDFFTAIGFYKPTSYNLMIKYSNSYFNYLIRTKVINSNPIKTIGIKTRREEFNPNPCNTKDLKQLLSGIDVRTYAGLRDYSMILLIADTGIRPNEACKLLVDDLVFPENLIYIREEISKTSKERVLPTSTKVMIYLKALLRYNISSPYVFNTIKGEQFTTDRFRRRLARYSDYTGVDITPYQLRHYFGTEYARNEGCNLLYLQKILGHSKLEMTRRYVKIETEDLARNHKVASPIDKLD